MRLIHLQADQLIPKDLKGSVVALGNFDGVHLGHQEILNLAVKDYAQKAQKPALVLSFEPHPRQYFDQSLNTGFRLTPLEIKAYYMEKFGLDGMVILPFNQDLASLSPDQFIRQFLIEHIEATQLIVGHDFHFGHKRQGTPSLLKSYSEFKTHIVEAVYDQHQALYASSKIRQYLDQSAIKAANAMLGHEYLIAGNVVEGRKLGRQIGFPTANIAYGDQKMPSFGVYAVRIYQDFKPRYRGIANYGVKPTIAGGLSPSFEVHIFDFDQDIYGKALQISLIDHIRGEQKFNSLDELKTQIAKDCVKARSSE